MPFDFFQRHRAGVFLFLFSTVSLLCLTLRIDPYVEGVKSAIWFFISPEVVYSGQFFNKFDALRGRFFRLVQIEGENVILRQQVSELSKGELERDALEKENNRLRNLLQLKEKYFPQSTAAEVIGRDIRDWFNSVIIDKGENFALKPFAAVVAGKLPDMTLVGRLTSVNDKFSKVLLITDLESSISVAVESTGDVGLLEGRNRPGCLLKYLSLESKIQPGDRILTEGLGGVFPPGIPVGVVTDVTISIDGFFKEATVKPFANFGSLRTVLILQRELKEVTSPL